MAPPPAELDASLRAEPPRRRRICGLMRGPAAAVVAGAVEVARAHVHLGDAFVGVPAAQARVRPGLAFAGEPDTHASVRLGFAIAEEPAAHALVLFGLAAFIGAAAGCARARAAVAVRAFARAASFSPHPGVVRSLAAVYGSAVDAYTQVLVAAATEPPAPARRASACARGHFALFGAGAHQVESSAWYQFCPQGRQEKWPGRRPTAAACRPRLRSPRRPSPTVSRPRTA